VVGFELDQGQGFVASLPRPARGLLARSITQVTCSSAGATVHDELRPLLQLLVIGPFRPDGIVESFSTIKAFNGGGVVYLTPNSQPESLRLTCPAWETLPVGQTDHLPPKLRVHGAIPPYVLIYIFI
jgi:hypothetical protein